MTLSRESPSESNWETLDRDREWVADLNVCSNRWLDASIEALVEAVIRIGAELTSIYGSS